MRRRKTVVATALLLVAGVITGTSSGEEVESRARAHARPAEAEDLDFEERNESFLDLVKALRFESVSVSPRAVVPPGSYSLSIDGDFDLRGAVFKNGYPFLHSDGGLAGLNTALGREALIATTAGVGVGNTALGLYALRSDTVGVGNTAVGAFSLQNTTEGSYNTAVGNTSLTLNTLGKENTALGAFTLVHNSEGIENTAVGFGALLSNETSQGITAIGHSALYYNTSGGGTAVGHDALRSNTTGTGNSALGNGALSSNTIGERNTAVGQGAILSVEEGFHNTAVGECALCSLTSGDGNTVVGAESFDLGATGSFNTVVGSFALESNTGSNNLALGNTAGNNATNGSHNIFIANEGVAADAGKIRIGNSNHTQTFIAGIVGVTLPMSGSTVFIDNNNQLGTATSSRRFKEAIEDMGDASGVLAKLRPVTFRYTKEAIGDGPRPLEFGLIAEEVAEASPNLVIYDEQGEPYSVRYHVLTPMLLNELQRLRGQVAALERRNQELERFEVRLQELEARLDQ